MTAEPLQPCDLVMKGGVTSGIVYPPVVLELKKHYRFRNIGGTSAGAIAAAGTAAAEFNREDCGFTQLAHISDWLGEDSHLRNLFQPSADTKPLMNLVDALFPPIPPKQAKRVQQTGYKPSALQSLLSMLQFVGRLIRIWATYYPPRSLSAALGTIIGFVVALFLPLAVFGVISLFLPEAWYALVIKLAFLLVFGAAGAWFGLQVGGVVDAITKLPDNFYGICSGHSETVPNVLTDWLSDQFNKIAGLKGDKPLTFGDLKDKQPQNGQDAGITLMMITSNLSQGQPYVLPSGLEGFLFKEDDMRKLFPGYVVDHMVTCAAKVKSPIISNDKLPELPEGERYHFLPHEDDLPVVVAMRLSLSFPVLLSAVPLYTIRASALKDPKQGPQPQLHKCDMQRNWFSDGGICNNFPIEFFDAWLPRWPTFGINLTSMPAKAFKAENQQTVSSHNSSTAGSAKAETRRLSKASFSALDLDYERRTAGDGPEDVYLPRVDALQDPAWQDLSGVVAFLWAIIRTGLSYRDTMQANLPSYRERVAQIRLSDDEGGLNLNMPPDVIGNIVKKGTAAGELFWNPDNDPHKFNLEQHQWVRFRVLMAKLEENFEKSQDTVLSLALEKLLDAQASAYDKDPYPYKEEPQWCDEAEASVNKLRDPIEFWQDRTPRLFRDGVPKPEAVLRVTPEI